MKDYAPDSEIVALIRRLLNASDVTPVVPVGDGCDHWAFDVNGAFIARVRKYTDTDTAAAVERETALLNIIARVSLIPVPLVVAAEFQAGLVVFRRLPGNSELFNRAFVATVKPLIGPLLECNPDRSDRRIRGPQR